MTVVNKMPSALLLVFVRTYSIITTQNTNITFGKLPVTGGARGGVVVKALRYKPVGSGFDSRWCHCNFSVT